MSTSFGLPPGFLYGGDYNPEQWLAYPEILRADIALMREAHINAVTLGVFSWAALEPREGVFTLDWLRRIVDDLYEAGICTVLATPSGARPRWLAEKYPEVLRVRPDRTRNLFGGRHNHCYTSPAYRDKVRTIDRKLAEAFGAHPAVVLWHLSNEYGGECHCPLCQEAFRGWLRERYSGDIDALNHAWWTAFWSHSYDSFEQVESPSPLGDTVVHGLNLDWKRFVTAQTADFIRHEIRALREAGAEQPTTINLMEDYQGLDYAVLADCVDIVSWDSYPRWHHGPDTATAADVAWQHDLMRSLKGQPFLLMESCPSSPNWHAVSKLKRPGMLACAGLQAVAHGADSVQFFQIRQGRGGSEKFHGAVIDHYGGSDTRVYREVAELGGALRDLGFLAGTPVEADAALLWDMESRWAMEDAQGPRNQGLRYHAAVMKAYRGLRRCGLNVDVLPSGRPLGSYRIVIAPMLYMFRSGLPERLRSFVAEGGTLIMTYWSGVADETDLCFTGPSPHGITDVLGLRRAEIDALYDGETNLLAPMGRGLSGKKSYSCRSLCEIVELEGAEPLLGYDRDFYRGAAALTVHRFGSGRAYYLAADAEADLYTDLIRAVLRETGAQPLLAGLPAEVCASSRRGRNAEFLFLQNYGAKEVQVDLPEDCRVLFGPEGGLLSAYGTMILRRPG